MHFHSCRGWGHSLSGAPRFAKPTRTLDLNVLVIAWLGDIFRAILDGRGEAGARAMTRRLTGFGS